MTEKQLISTIKYVSSTKPAFFLSEIIPYLDEPLSLNTLFTIISPKLPGLGLMAKEVKGDFKISRIPPALPLLLNKEERERQEAFFTAGVIPLTLAQSIEKYITKKVGKDWNDPVIIERLRRAIVAQKDDYWKPAHKRSLQYTKGYSVLGYLAYHFPVYFMQTGYLLMMLTRDGLLKKNMTILDVGTGPGIVPLAIADFYSRLDDAEATIYSLERSEEHIEAFTFLRDALFGTGGRVTIKPPVKTDIRSIETTALPEKIDLVIFSNVLNELPDATMELRADIVHLLSERLAPDGSILIVEPADEENATRMRSLTVALQKKGLSIYGPCSFIWGSTCTAPRCWSFETAPAIRITRLMETLAHCEDSYRYVNTDIKYSYAVLRKDGMRKENFRMPEGSKFLRLSKLHLHLGKRINVAGLKMSGELGDARSHVFKLCDGTAKTPVYAVLPSYHITPENDAITSAPYGSLLELRNVLVRYNKAHDAYNLLVSRNTGIHTAGAADE
ncbi:MAG: methyltransferase domain-containing protein [Methanoregula sp.]|jgi:SAM-dependent methyltransferase|nr:methyltransferase domain-containing protein [Methanoregula sp.]